MQNTDIILLIPLAWGVIRGFYKGLIAEIASLAGIILAVYFSVKYYNPAAHLITAHFESKMSQFYISIAAFAILFILSLVIVHLISRKIQSWIEKLHLGMFNHFMGGLFGFIKWALIVGVVLFFLNMFVSKTHISLFKFSDTFIYKTLSEIVPKFIK